jgi:hypothetical protein
LALQFYRLFLSAKIGFAILLILTAVVMDFVLLAQIKIWSIAEIIYLANN